MKLIVTFFLTTLSLNFGLFSLKSAQAQSVRSVQLNTMESYPEAIPLDIHEGYGMNISFLNTDQVIVFAVLDNPANYSLILDGSPCEGQTCGSQLIHLRLLKDINLPHITISANNHTFLNIKTVDSQNRTKLYVFRLKPKKGVPSHHTFAFQPSQPQNQTVTAGNALDLAYVTQGMIFAQAQQKLPDNPALWQRIQAFIVYVRQGIPYLEATRKAGVSLALIHKLEAWGKEAMELENPLKATNFQ